MPKSKEIEPRSEEIQELISKNPPAIIRWGNMVFLFVLLVLLMLAYMIEYPDVVQASFKLTSLNAPKSIHTKITGKLVRLLIKENSFVKKGTILAFLESTANHEEILNLSTVVDSLIQSFSKNELISLRNWDFGKYRQLGELQVAFQSFSQVFIQYQTFMGNEGWLKKRQLLFKELEDLKLLQNNLTKQHKLLEKDLKLAEEEFKIQQKLALQKVIATLEFKREESKLLAKQMPLHQSESAVINNSAAQNSKQKEILELDKSISEQQNLFMQALFTLKSSIDDWKSKYVLIASLTGNVYFSNLLQENQTLNAGQEVFFNAPASSREVGEIWIPQNNLGKVRTGQKVVIKFKGYPFQEFGSVEGKIDFIAEIPIKDSVFLARVILPKGLKTNFNKKLNYKSGMKATAEIITEDKRLIDRFIYLSRKTLDK